MEILELVNEVCRKIGKQGKMAGKGDDILYIVT